MHLQSASSEAFVFFGFEAAGEDVDVNDFLRFFDVEEEEGGGVGCTTAVRGASGAIFRTRKSR